MLQAPSPAGSPHNKRDLKMPKTPKGPECPKCGSSESLYVQASVAARLNADMTFDTTLEKLSVCEDSLAWCHAAGCEWAGILSELTKGN